MYRNARWLLAILLTLPLTLSVVGCGGDDGDNNQVVNVNLGTGPVTADGLDLRGTWSGRIELAQKTGGDPECGLGYPIDISATIIQNGNEVQLSIEDLTNPAPDSGLNVTANLSGNQFHFEEALNNEDGSTDTTGITLNFADDGQSASGTGLNGWDDPQGNDDCMEHQTFAITKQ